MAEVLRWGVLVRIQKCWLVGAVAVGLALCLPDAARTQGPGGAPDRDADPARARSSAGAPVQTPGSDARPDTVRVAVLQDWPPHYLFPEGGEPAGFAVDVIGAVAGRTDLVPRYRRYAAFPDAMAALRAGEVDVIPDLGAISSRAEDFLFTRPFDAFPVSVLVRSSSPTIQSRDDLAGARVGVVRFNVGVELLAENYPDAEAVVFESVREVLFELLAAGVDAVIYPEEVFLALARSAGLEQRIEALPEPLLEVPRAMGVRPEARALRERLDAGIEGLVGTAEYEEIQRRWFGDPEPYLTVEELAWGAGVLLLAILLGMGAWRYRSVSRLARKLEEESARFKTLVETAHEAIALMDNDERVVFANRRLCDLLGVSREEIEGTSAFRYVLEEDLPKVLEGVERRRRGRADTYEVRLRRSDGEVVWAILSAAPVTGEEGEYAGIVVTLTDITDLVRTRQRLEERERRFRAFVENASDLISTLDREGHMLTQSSPIKRLLGYEAEELRGDSVFDYIHPDDRPAARRAWERLVAEPGATLELDEFRFRHADGSWRIWETTLTNLLDEPAVEAVLANSRDVTEKKELERRLRQSQKLEAVGRLAGGVAHDFNNLLTVIRANTEFLASKIGDSDDGTEEVGAIRAAADRAAELTNQLLAFGAEQLLRPRVVDPNQVVRDVRRLVSRTLGEDIRIELELASDPPAIEVDPSQLDQVLLNLAVNARDAMPEGGTLTLSTGVLEVGEADDEREVDLAPGTYVRFDVVDTGVGMDEQVRERIFEPFFTTKGEVGTGLGLATAFGIVSQSGGAIQVETEPGEGSEFSIFFPAVDREPEDDDGAGKVAGAEVDRGGRILVVEDDAAVRRVTRSVLERAGFEVETTETAEAGLETLDAAAGAFDAVITDLVLPGMGGRELIDVLRERPASPPLLAMSGYDKRSPGRRGDLPRDVLFIRKPFGPDELVRTVRQALIRSRPGGDRPG